MPATKVVTYIYVYNKFKKLTKYSTCINKYKFVFRQLAEFIYDGVMSFQPKRFYIKINM